jgi:hypothetical protein
MAKNTPHYLEYISIEKREKAHISLLKDIYYFYHGVKPGVIIQLNGDLTDYSKENLVLTVV